jgi:hypothetical protein
MIAINTTETSWSRVVSDFRRVCLARREQRGEEADRLLREDLPRSITEWSRETRMDEAKKRTQLDQMFQAEQRRVDDAWVLHNLLTLRLTDEIVPSIVARVTESVREAISSGAATAGRGVRHAVRLAKPRRVAFDDVAGVIDLLLQQELSSRSPELRASVS